MAIKSYRQVIDTLELFADNHQMVNAFSSSFFEQFDQVVHNQPQWPIIYVVPDSITFEPYINSMRFRVYCVDLLQRDRSNEADILNDTIIILKDLYNWTKINDNNDLNILNIPTAIPVNNFLTELTVGWYIDLDFEVQAPANECDIPFTENFILTGITCDYTYATNLLTCTTLENCAVFRNLQGEIISGGTFNSGTLTLDKVSGDQITITGFTSGSVTDIYTTGSTLSTDNTLTFTRNDGNSYDVYLDNIQTSFNFTSGTTAYVYNYIVPEDLKFDSASASPSVSFNLNTISGSYNFGDTLNKFDTLTLSASTYGLIILNGKIL